MILSSTGKFDFIQTTWLSSSGEILAVRHKVFMIEQRFGGNVLCDLLDPSCYHIIVKNNIDETIAAGRLTEEGRIGRIAVRLSYRNKGIGSQLLTELVNIGYQNGLKNISLNAELGNTEFYNNQDFAASGPVYMKNGVPHQMLTKKLA